MDKQSGYGTAWQGILFFCMLGYLLQTANPTSSFKDRLKALVNEYKSVAPLSAMGFAEGWENEKIWK